MQLSAQQRYSTLQAMGTRLWVPRVLLPGAAPSTACDWPAPVKPPSARERLLQQIAPQAIPQAPPIHQTPVPEQHIHAPAEAVQTPAPTTQTVQVAQPVLEVQPPQVIIQPVQADVWLLANGWQLVMENLTGQPGLQEGDIKLLHNLLVALYPGGLGVSDQQFFSWPLPGIPVEAGNEGELSMTLQAFLTGARFQGVQLAGCLVFGERLKGLLAESAHLPRLFTAPSLAYLQQNPAAKQEFWLQAGSSGLRAAFASSPVML